MVEMIRKLNIILGDGVKEITDIEYEVAKKLKGIGNKKTLH